MNYLHPDKLVSVTNIVAKKPKKAKAQPGGLIAGLAAQLYQQRQPAQKG